QTSGCSCSAISVSKLGTCSSIHVERVAPDPLAMVRSCIVTSAASDRPRARMSSKALTENLRSFVVAREMLRGRPEDTQMTKPRVSTCAFVVAASLAGCARTGEVEYAGEVRVTSPQLIQLSPGVQVVADADEPMFFSHGYYWLYRDGYWFRSTNDRRGFV